MNLIQTTTLAGRVGISPLTDEAGLAAAVTYTGALFEAYLNRRLARVEDEVYQTRANHREVVLPRYPVEEVSKVEIKYADSIAWREELGVDPLIDGPTGVVDLGHEWGTAHELIRITYTGGYVLPGATVGAGQTALPDDIQAAALEQAAWLYQNRHALRLTGTPGASAAVRQNLEADLLATVLMALAPYRRLII